VTPNEKQVALAVKHKLRPVLPALRHEFAGDDTRAAIIVALVDARRAGTGQVSYSRTREFYDQRQRHDLLTYRRVRRAVDALDEAGLITHFRQSPGQRGWQSWMAATPALIDLAAPIISAHAPLELQRPARAIQLRDADGRPLPVPDTRAMARAEARTAAINEAICAARVEAEGGALLAAPVVRIFNRDLMRGGRFYGVGASWQNIPRETRQRIAIDGEAVVELDYSALHPAMLYSEAGAPLPTDCYAVGHWPRPLVKRALLTLINAATIQAARLSIAHADEIIVVAEPGSQQAMAEAQRLIGDIKRHHRPIAGAFHSDAGARLMRRDSDLAEQVMLALLRRGIVALPLHDSFLVPASKRDDLEAAMMAEAHAIGLHQIRVKSA
jgi:hypothetical protein